MTHFEIHALERRIAETIKKGFSRPTSPHEKSYDSGDFLQMGHDVADMLLGEYFVDVKPIEVDTSLSKAIESAAFGIEGLAKALNAWAMDASKSPRTW